MEQKYQSFDTTTSTNPTTSPTIESITIALNEKCHKYVWRVNKKIFDSIGNWTFIMVILNMNL